MILAPHMLVGSALALRIGNPLLGIPVAIASHYLLDATPHAEYPIDKLYVLRTKNFRSALPTILIICTDVGAAVLSIILAAHYAHQSLLFALAGGFAGILPDGATFLHILFPKNVLLTKHRAFHRLVHFPKEKHVSAFLRYGLQGAAAILSIAVIANIHSA